MALVGLGCWLRFYHLGSKSLWLDEVFNVLDSAHPVSEIPRIVYSSPPLFYGFCHIVAGWLGPGDFSARAASAFFGVLTLPLFFAIVRRLVGIREAALGLLLLTVSPCHVAYSQEARMYVFAGLEVLVSLYFLERALEQPHVKAHWAGLGGAHIAGLYTHNWFLFFTAAQGCYLLLCCRDRRDLRLPFFMTFGAIALVYGPWIPQLIVQSKEAHFERLQKPTFMDLIQTLRALASLHVEIGDGVLQFPPMLLWPATAVVVLLLAWGWQSRPETRTVLRRLFVVGCAGPLLMAFLFSLWVKPLYRASRYPLIALPAFLLLLAGAPFSGKKIRDGFAGGLLALLVMGWISSLRLYDRYFQKADWKYVASWMVSQMQRHDSVWMEPLGYEWICLNYYLPPNFARIPYPRDDRTHRRIFIVQPGLTPVRSEDLGPSLRTHWVVDSFTPFIRDSVVILRRKSSATDPSSNVEPSGANSPGRAHTPGV